MEYAGDYRNCEVHVNSIWQARTKAEARQIMGGRRKARQERSMKQVFEALDAHMTKAYARLSLT